MPYSDDPLQRRQDQLERNRQNKGRIASASFEATTTYTGVVEFDEPVDFGMIFIEKPRLHYGSEIDSDDFRNAMNLTDADLLPLPTCTGAVTKWDTDENDYYRGCWVAATVVMVVPTVAPIQVTHHFDFFGVALKTIPTDPTEN